MSCISLHRLSLQIDCLSNRQIRWSSGEKLTITFSSTNVTQHFAIRCQDFTYFINYGTDPERKIVIIVFNFWRITSLQYFYYIAQTLSNYDLK